MTGEHTARLDTLVVPLDGSSTATRVLPVVKSLARHHQAKVVLVTSTRDDQGAEESQLRDAAAQLEGIETVCRFIDNRSPADAAIDLALGKPGRVVCMSTHGRGGLRRAVLGSVAAEVVRSGLVATLLVGPSCDPDALDRPGPVELCVDGSERSPAIVSIGNQWAQGLDRDIHMVLVSHPMDPRTGVESADTFARLAAPLGLDVTAGIGTCAYGSSIPLALVGEAERRRSPLMVISPAHRGGLERLVLGSTTLSILSDAPCPVLVLPRNADVPFIAEAV